MTINPFFKRQAYNKRQTINPFFKRQACFQESLTGQKVRAAEAHITTRAAAIYDDDLRGS